MNLLQKLNGKKSYLTALGMIIYALLSVYFHQMNWQQAAIWLFGSAGLVSIKSALAKIENVAGGA